MIGLVGRDDGWRVLIGSLGADGAAAPAAAVASARLSQPAAAWPRRDGRHLARLADGDAVERLERDRDLHVELCAPSWSGVGARRVRGVLAAGAARLRRAARDRVAWLSCDGAMGKAPLGGEQAEPNPTDRAKRGEAVRYLRRRASRSGSRSAARTSTTSSSFRATLESILR